MKLVQINVTCGSGSTGKICVAVSDLLTSRGIENHILYAFGQSDHPLGRRYMTPLEVKFQALKSRIFGNYGFNSKGATGRLLAALDEIQPDIVHLHNLHGHNCDLQMLFSYLKKKRIKMFWTFHDCWAFTGYCPHYDMIGCSRWQTECKNCPQRKRYSWFLDRSHILYEKKKTLFTGLDMTIVTPSQWMARQVKQSFLYNYPVRVIPNGIDLTIFKPTPGLFRKKHNCENRFIVLGVAFGWSERKGLDVFIELSRRLDQRFQIVLVGTNDDVDSCLPDTIISIHRTQDQRELAELYSAADLFVNPTREENYPTVNMEAIACGTPVLTFQTGGSAEMLTPGCGATVMKNDIDALEREILRLYDTPFEPEECLIQAQNFDQTRCFEECVKLYETKNPGND